MTEEQNQKMQVPKEVQKESTNFKYIVRIANTDLDGKKQLLMGLQKIKGVSFMFANAICNLTKISKTKRIGDLTEKEIESLENIVKSKKPTGIPTWIFNRRADYETGEDIHLIGADLTFSNESDLRRLKKIKSYRGIRHMLGQPTRGQRTKSNFRKNKGKVTSIKRSVVAKADSAAKAKEAKK